MANEFIIKNGYFSQGNSIITGSLTVTAGVTASLFGTASWAISASVANSSSYAFSASYALSASRAVSASRADSAVSASYALSSSYAVSSSYAFSSSYAVSASRAISASRADTSFSSSYALTASFSETASYVNPLRQVVYITGSLIVSASGTANDMLVGANKLFVSASGNVGIGTTTPSEKLQVYGNTIISTGDTGSKLGINISPTYSLDVVGNTMRLSMIPYTMVEYSGIYDGARQMLLSGPTDTSPQYVLSDGISDIGFGVRGNTTSNTSYMLGLGAQGDTFINASANANGINIVNNPTLTPGTKDDYIRLYAGQYPYVSNPADIHIQGSGSTRGNVGIGVNDPTLAKLQIAGNVYATSYTGSLLGTASFADASTSSSYSISSSYAVTASYVLNAVSASFSQTASYLNTLNQDLTFNGNLTLNGTASIAYLNVAYESASIIYSSGSNQLGDATDDVQTLIGSTRLSGSLSVTGSTSLSGSLTVINHVTAPAFTGSLFGTGSWAVSSSRAVSASRADSAVSASYSLTASFASTASYAVSSSYAVSASYALSSSFAASSSRAVSSSRADSTLSASFALTASYVNPLTQFVTITGSLIVSSSGNIADLVIGTSKLYVSASGNVGIGTTTPIASLHVDRIDVLNAAGARPTGVWASIIENRRDVAGYNGLSVVNRWGAGDSKIFEVASAWDGGAQVYTPALTVFGDRRVGIGTTSPSQSLEINDVFGITGYAGAYSDLTHNVYWKNSTHWASKKGGPGTLIRTNGGTTSNGSIVFSIGAASTAAAIAASASLVDMMTLNSTGLTIAGTLSATSYTGNFGYNGPAATVSMSRNTVPASLYKTGRALHVDPNFSSGVNDIYYYNNHPSGSGVVTVTRISASAAGLASPAISLGDGYSGSANHILKIAYVSGATDPGLGGWAFRDDSYPNATIVTVFKAWIPSGFNLAWATNSPGAGWQGQWVTTTSGSGKWEDYVFMLQCGPSASFNTTNYFYLEQPAGFTGTSFNWYLADANSYIISDSTTKVTPRLGVGVNNPESALHVIGSNTIGGVGNVGLKVESATGAGTGGVLIGSITGNTPFVASDNTNAALPLSFITNNTIQQVIRSNGAVSIGTTDTTSTLATKLYIAGAAPTSTVNTSGSLQIYSVVHPLPNTDQLHIHNVRTTAGSDWTGTGYRMQNKIDNTWMGYMQWNGGNDNGISFGTGTGTSPHLVSERMRITGTGRVGIGVTNPTATLHVTIL